jgi:hypothetical protein
MPSMLNMISPPSSSIGVVKRPLPPLPIELELTCRSATRPVLAGAEPMGLLDTLGWRPWSEPADSARPRRVRCNCWDIMLMEDCRGGEARYGEMSPELLDRATGLDLGLAPGCSEELRNGEPT